MTETKPYTCVDCGAAGEQPKRGRRRMRCDDCRSVYNAARYTGERVRKCPTCASVVTGDKKTYCTEACKPAGNQLTYREKKAAAAPRQCAECGDVYRSTKPAQRYCSLACYNRAFPPQAKGMNSRRFSPEEARERVRASWQVKNRRRRAQLRGAASEPYTTAEIAERDRFRCGLCGKRVPMDVKVPSPLAPTIDHILPLFEGGDDTKANVQLAHFRCNSAKGPRGSQQLALIG